MSEKAFRRVYDGFRNLAGGVDSGLSPELISPDQCAWAINVTMRGGKPRTRPSFVRRALAYGQAGWATTANAAVWQIAGDYLSDSGVGSLVFMAGGRIYQVAVTGAPTYQVTDASPANATNPSNLNTGWSIQAECFRIFQDGSTLPIIFNGSGSRYATPEEIKTGTVMAYQNGRIWYSVGTTGFAFRATDLVGNRDSGTAQYNYRDSVLHETENTFLNEGGDFMVPSSAGPIQAMGAPAQLDTSQGQGPLQVLTTGAVFSVNAPLDRETWKDITYPIQTISLTEKGAIGWLAVANGDLWFRSDDGVRSFVVARREFGQSGNTPQSDEMKRLLAYDNRILLPFGSATVFDNRLLGTAVPTLTANGSIVHTSLAVLDFSLASGLRRHVQPAWEGVWTGLRIHQVVRGRFDGVERCFMFCRDAADTELQLWELVYDTGAVTADQPTTTTRTRIPCVMETRSMSFRNENALKRQDVASVFVADMQDTVGFDVKYRPDGYPCWFDWHSWSECATIEQCMVNDGTCKTFANNRPQYRPKMRLPVPQDVCVDSTGMISRDFFEMAYRIAWTGHCTVSRFISSAIDLPEPAHGACLGVAVCKTLDCCTPAEGYDASG